LRCTSSYLELRPPPALASHACCVWTHTAGASGHVQRVLPDGCADIVLLVEGAGALVIAGPATRHVLVEIPPGGTALGIRFGPGAVAAALGVPAVELQDRTVELSAIWGRQGTELAERLADAAPRERLGVLGAAVAGRLREAPAPDALVAHASRLLAGGVPVAATGREVGLGERHLRRRFHVAVGYGPKTLQRILRLRRFLRLAEETDGFDLARAAVEAGYADQPHLTRECADLAGLPPAALLASRQPAAEADGVATALGAGGSRKGSRRPGRRRSASRMASSTSTSGTS
jgi:AraC-like DNA-binding protein